MTLPITIDGPETALDVLREFGFEREHDVLHQAMCDPDGPYRIELEQMVEDEIAQLKAEGLAYLELQKKIIQIPKPRNQDERAEILYQAMRKRPLGTFFPEKEAISLIGHEYLSQVVSKTRKLFAKEDIVLSDKRAEGYFCNKP